jgi:hypothetical protein
MLGTPCMVVQPRFVSEDAVLMRSVCLSLFDRINNRQQVPRHPLYLLSLIGLLNDYSFGMFVHIFDDKNNRVARYCHPPAYLRDSRLCHNPPKEADGDVQRGRMRFGDVE